MFADIVYLALVKFFLETIVTWMMVDAKFHAAIPLLFLKNNVPMMEETDRRFLAPQLTDHV